MKQFTMSQYATKEDLYKAKAEYLEKQLRWIARQAWFQNEASFWLVNDGEDGEDSYFNTMTDAIDEVLTNDAKS